MTTTADKPNIYQPLHRILEILGLDPNLVAKLEIDREDVVANTYVRNDNGAKLLGNDGAPVYNVSIIAVTTRPGTEEAP